MTILKFFMFAYCQIDAIRFWYLFNPFQIEDDIFAFSSAVGILHNCARNPNIDKDKFRKVKATEHLLPFLHSAIPCKLKCSILFCVPLKEEILNAKL